MNTSIERKNNNNIKITNYHINNLINNNSLDNISDIFNKNNSNNEINENNYCSNDSIDFTERIFYPTFRNYQISNIYNQTFMFGGIDTRKNNVVCNN